MFKRLLIAHAICSLLFATTTEQRINNFLPKFEQYIKKTMPDWAIPGMGIVIVTPTKVLFCKGFGTREVGKNKPVDQHTIFQIASLSKNFTASIAGILESKKVFNLHDLVKKYLPNFSLANKEAADKATLQDLISHNMGIEQFAGDTLMKLWLTPNKIIEKFSLIPFKYSFREDYTYSNQMFGFMGLVMENATNKKYSELFNEYISKPLGMTRSSAGSSLIEKQESLLNKLKSLFAYDENIALCHDKDSDGNAVCIGLDSLVYVYPSTSGVNTTAHDLGIWLQCQLNNGKHENNQIIPEKHIKAMRTAAVKHTNIKPKDMQWPPEFIKNVGYGMGWFMYDYGKENNTIQIFEHTGGYAGQRALAWMCHSEGFAVAIITNLGQYNVNLYPEALRNVFLDFFLNLEKYDWSKDYLDRKKKHYARIKNQRIARKLAKLEPKRDDKFYTGTYYNELYGEIEITKNTDRLLFKANNHSCSLEHWNGDEFSFNGYEFNCNMSRSDQNFIEFGTNDKGETIAYVSFLFEGIDPIFVKKSQH